MTTPNACERCGATPADRAAVEVRNVLPTFPWLIAVVDLCGACREALKADIAATVDRFQARVKEAKPC